ncbi:MAG: ATP-binding protein [Marmoricola sp.]
MRRIAEAPESAPTRRGDGAFTPTSWQQMAPYVAFAGACYLVAPYLGLDSFTVDPRIAEVWPPGGVGFVLLTTVWFAGKRVIAMTLVLMTLVFFVTAAVLWHDVAPALWMALVGAAQPLLMAVIYRRRLNHTGWAPESQQDVAALLFAAVGSSLLLALVGGFPTLNPNDLPTSFLWWWVLRNTVFCFVGGVTFMVMFYGPRRGALPPTSWLNRVGLVVTTFVCVYGSYHDPSLPLSWLLIIPSVWGGLTLTVRGTGYLAITLALAAASMSYLPQNQFGYSGAFPASSIMDLLVIACTAFFLLLVLMREQRAALIAELDRKGVESESQRRMLETVFDSMTDGVIIVDDSRVSMYNAAARQLLGRPILAGTPGSWAGDFGLKAANGGPLDDDTLHEALWVDADDGTKTLQVLVGQDGARTLDISTLPLGTVEERSTMVLLHDVTAQRARMQELTNFAGMVAHDLRGPLTVLDGWLEVVEDGDPVEEGVLVDDAVRKARESSRRMRQVIEDWLNYTVVQNGQLRPEAVKLYGVANEITDGRRASWAGDDEPEFFLELDHTVFADPGLLRQLLDNLVGNAVKYTSPDERPWVLIRSEADEEPGWIRIDVVDHGVGIPEGEEELIFEEFHRGPQEGRSAGTGLGLALTRRIVGLHGGQMKALRNPEGGSTFTFTLPEG